MPNPSKTIGKLGNVGIAGFGWETEQVYHSSLDLTSGEQLLPAPELFSRSNHITSLNLSASNAGVTVHFSGAGGGSPSLSLIMGQSALTNSSPSYCSLIDPISFPTGQAVHIVSDNTGVIYATVKYFVE